MDNEKRPYVVKHWCDSEILGVFDSKEKALYCVSNHIPKQGAPSWVREEYDIVSFAINEEGSEEDVYKVRDLYN